MNVTYMYQPVGRQTELNICLEEVFYKELSQKLSKEPIEEAHDVIVSLLTGEQAVFNVCSRGGTAFIREESNNLPQSLVGSMYPHVFLTCVNPAQNNYKFYELELVGDEILASYGRMGENGRGALGSTRNFKYPKSMFGIKYAEKISKGYVDRSEIFLADRGANEDLTEKESSEEMISSNIATKESFDLLKKLVAYSNQALSDARIDICVTNAMVKASKELLAALRRKRSDVKAFNDILLELVSISQRPMSWGSSNGVANALAKTSKDFSSILKREESLVQAMEGSLMQKKSSHAKSFADFDIEVYKATDEQCESVLRHLSDELRNNVRNVYRVVPREQQKRFNDYLKESKCAKVKQFWHGSRNENWASIVKNGLLLNPDARITGKMFGDGIYFAPSSNKSWGYTSAHGSYWAGGKSSTAFMGLYATAYGSPLKVKTWSSSCDYADIVKRRGNNCLHAEAGASLRNDEIIFYNEKSVVLNYVVEFKI